MKKIYKGCIFNFYRYEERILNSRFFFSALQYLQNVEIQKCKFKYI